MFFLCGHFSDYIYVYILLKKLFGQDNDDIYEKKGKHNYSH